MSLSIETYLLLLKHQFLDKDKILSLALLASEKSVYIRPSNTLFYFPLFSELRNILLEGILGKAYF